MWAIYIPEVERALASMTNLQGIFSRLPEPNIDDMRQLNILKRYGETGLQKLIKKTKKDYTDIFQIDVELLGTLNKFVRINGFDSTDLNKKNAKVYTPLILALLEKHNVFSHLDPKDTKVVIPLNPNDAEEIIPYIKRHTSPTL